MEIKNNKAVNAFISRTILEVLIHYGMDFERIFTFSVYMQMVIIKSCFPVQIQAGQIIDEILSYWINNKDNSKHTEEKISDEELSNLYTANRGLMMEIYDDVWNNCPPDSEWIKDWNQACIKACNKNNSPYENCIELLDALNVHLEASHNELISTLYLIKKTLQLSWTYFNKQKKQESNKESIYGKA